MKAMSHTLASLFAATTVVLFGPSQGFAAQPTAGLQVVQLRVEGMVSPSCSLILRTAAKKVLGVIEVEADLESHSARVEFDPVSTTVEDVQRAIHDKAGFRTTLVTSSTN